MTSLAFRTFEQCTSFSDTVGEPQQFLVSYSKHYAVPCPSDELKETQALAWAAIFMYPVGVIMVSAQALFIQSMKRSDASYVLPFLYITLVFASVYDYFIFTTHPDWISVLGAMTIVSGELLLGIGESVRKERGKSGSAK